MAFEAGASGTRAVRVAEADGHRVRFPRGASGCEAVLINTGGGVAGGDAVRIEASLAPGAAATISSATAERVYRALGRPARIEVAARLAAGSVLAWLPQETILYCGAKLERRIEVEMAEDARLTLADIIVLGRRAAGEQMTAGNLSDRWTIRRGGQLAHAEAVRLKGPIDEIMQHAATGNGAHVAATLVHLTPDAEHQLDGVRAAMQSSGVDTAASAWDGKLVVRVLGHRSDQVRAAIAAAATLLTGRPMPRVWAT